jgi:hypothetical protein
MTRLSTLFFLILLLSFSSCGPFYRIVFGIKNPKMETFHSINKYSKDLTIDSVNVVFAKDSASQLKLLRIFARTPDILIFDGHKNFIPYKDDSITCNASVDYILQNVCTLQKSTIFSKREVNYDSLFSCIDDPNRCYPQNYHINSSYTVFINFTKYMHGVNKTHLIPWNKIINDQKQPCPIKYVFVNLDYLCNWGMKQNSLPTLNMKQDN